MKRHAPCPRRVYRYTRGRRENSGGFRPSPPFEYAGLATGCREKERERQREKKRNNASLLAEKTFLFAFFSSVLRIFKRNSYTIYSDCANGADAALVPSLRDIKENLGKEGRGGYIISGNERRGCWKDGSCATANRNYPVRIGRSTREKGRE